MFAKRVKHYHQWLRSAIPFKAKLDQISSDSVRVQGPTKRSSLGHLYPVSPVKERHRKGRKCKISRALQPPVLSTQASPKVEASHRLKQAQHFSTRGKVHQEIPLQLPVSTTLLKQSHKLVFHNNPQHLNLHAWCLVADNSKNKASLWRWQRELLPLSGHQQGPSTSQSGPYLKNGAEKIRWISPLHL